MLRMHLNQMWRAGQVFENLEFFEILLPDFRILGLEFDDLDGECFFRPVHVDCPVDLAVFPLA